jgi:hypothetical protein
VKDGKDTKAIIDCVLSTVNRELQAARNVFVHARKRAIEVQRQFNPSNLRATFKQKDSDQFKP